MFPEKYRRLSGSFLKTLALITMFIDHTAGAFFRNDKTCLFILMNKRVTPYILMKTIGRIAFPIFVFLLTEGFVHTRDRKKYGIRLFLFALISEIPWNLEHSGKLFYSSQNVFFTLFLGYLGLVLIERIETMQGRQRNYSVVALLCLLIISYVWEADYGCTGFGFILLMYLLRKFPLYRAVIGSCFLSSQWKAGLAFIPIALYNGKRGFIRGRFLQICFYAFYPLHMLLLYFIKVNTIGY